MLRLKMKDGNIFMRIVSFYVEGFRSMTIGRKLWLLIIVKLFILFAVVKLFFFPDFLADNYGDDDASKASGVLENLAAPVPRTVNISN